MTKAYCTRVGGGPFPTEALDDQGELLRTRRNEYGAVTGRPAALRLDGFASSALRWHD